VGDNTKSLHSVGENTKVGNNTLVGESTNLAELDKTDRTPLLPLRHTQGDFFVCDIFDAVPKGDMASMAHPIFSLSTKPDRRTRRYESKQGFVEVRPNIVGLATVHDRDVLIYCISQVMAALNDGRDISQVLRFKALDLLIATNRNTDGRAYEQLKAAFERLQGTQIETNITTGGVEQIDIFSLIDRVRIIRETREGRMIEVEITLSDWVFNAINGREVLTLNRRYFQLRKPLERRLYELARKHCGTQDEWLCGLEKLKEKTGSNSTDKEFRRLVKSICADDRDHAHMPDYTFRLKADVLVVTPRKEFLDAMNGAPALPLFNVPPLLGDTFDEARQAAPGWDPYYLESEWRAWITEPPKNADKAFVGFCKKWFEKRGRP